MKKIISLLFMSIFLVGCFGGNDDKVTPPADNQVIIDDTPVEKPETVVEDVLSDEEIDEILDAFFNSVED